MVLKIILIVLLVYLFYINDRNNRLFDFVSNLNELGYSICQSYIKFSQEFDPDKADYLVEMWAGSCRYISNNYAKILFGFKSLKKESFLNEEQLKFYNLDFEV